MSEQEVPESIGRIEVAPEVITTIVHYTTLEVEGVNKMAAVPADVGVGDGGSGSGVTADPVGNVVPYSTLVRRIVSAATDTGLDAAVLVCRTWGERW